MTHVRWTILARRDIRDIVEWVESENPAAASRLRELIHSRVAQLEHMPRVGRRGRVAGTRELIVTRSAYLVVYHLEDEDSTAVIDRVIHQARRWPPR